MKLGVFLSMFFCINPARSNDTTIAETSEYVDEATESPKCGGELIGKLSILESPRSPGQTAGDYDCIYFLKSPEVCPVFYELEFVKFELLSSEGCVEERLEIDRQDALCGSNIQSKTYFARNGTLQLRYKARKDVHGTGKGFKILVSRSDCQTEQTTTESMTTTEYDTGAPELSFIPYNIPTYVEDPPRCCQNTYNSRRFLLTSPDFPYSLNTNKECTYVLHKASSNICRIRLNFQFFWMGQNSQNNCPHGYLAIDGKYICGCNKELKLVTTFGNSDLKVLTFKSFGINITSQSGFVIEVTQDECPRKYHPDNSGTDEPSSSQKLSQFNDQFNVLDYLGIPRETSIQKLQLTNERTEVSEESNYHYRERPRIVKTLYVFAEPSYNSLPIAPHNIEKTTYLDTESINSIVTSIDHYECGNWNRNQLDLLFERYSKNLQTCSQTQVVENVDRNDCFELDYLEGYFKSPGYPYYYPQNFKMCYRFKKQPGYCAIRIMMVDFYLEYSNHCEKDFVSFENHYKYCGNTLYGQTLTLDLTDKPYQDLTFVSDSTTSCRGFSGVFRQIACRSNFPDMEPTTSAPSCDRFVRQKNFRIEFSGDNRECSFRIQKYSQDVCRIDLYFEIFDLKCTVESLVVGSKMFCGHLSGEKVSVVFEDNETIKEMVYRSNSGNSYEPKFRIIGEQITDDCSDPKVPAQRLIQLPLDSPVPSKTNSWSENIGFDEQWRSYLTGMQIGKAIGE